MVATEERKYNSSVCTALHSGIRERLSKSSEHEKQWTEREREKQEESAPGNAVRHNMGMRLMHGKAL